MKILYLLFLLFAQEVVQAQIKIGFTESEIRTQLHHRNLQEGVNNEGIRFIFWENSDVIYGYYFSPEGFCNFTSIISISKEVFNSLYKLFNQGVLLKKNEWIWSNKDGVYWIRLSLEGKYPVFKVSPGNGK